MNELALFAGAGGGILGGLLLGWRTVCAVEIEDYPRRVLMQRQNDGCLEPFPIWDDIRTFDGKPWRGIVDVVSVAVPCQPFSYEGKRDWETSENNLWPEAKRVIQEVGAQHVLFENVPGIREYLPVVIRDLRRAGYNVDNPLEASAASAGCIHIRKRIWLCAYANSKRRGGFRDKQSPQAWSWSQTWPEFKGLVQDVLQSCVPASRGSGIHDGVADRVDRLRATGNGQVPQVVRLAWEILSGE